jgi:hypothetical protein
MQIKQLGRLLRLAVDERDAAFAASRHLRLAPKRWTWRY